MKKTVCTYCGVGCEIGFDRSSVVPIRSGVVSKGKLCVKGRFGHEFVNHPDRIKGALVKKRLLDEFKIDTSYFDRRGEFFSVPYETAYKIVAEKLKEIVSTHGSRSFAAVGGARTNCESAYLLQKFTREVVGSPHVDNCARICHAPSLKGLKETVGEGAASVPFDEIYNSEFIFVLGSNTTEAHPIVAHRIVEQARKGIPLAVLDVREIGLFKFAKYKLVIPFESNLLFLNAVARVIVENGLYDRDFVEKRVSNFEEFKEKILSDELSKPEVFRKIPGYEYLTEEIYRLAEEISKKKTLFMWGLGITEHEDGSETVMAIANLALLTGNVGRKGTGLLPLRGQNNVQGACDVGMLPYYLPDYKKPEEIGYMTPDIIDAALRGEIRALWVMGEDLAHVHPNSNKVKRALESLEFLVVNELFPCEVTKFADVVFGVKSCYEKTGVYINAERRIHLSQPVFDSELPDDWEVISAVSREMGVDFGFKTSEDVWNELRKDAPERFGEASYELLRKNFEEAPQWPVKDGRGTPVLYEEKFSTPDGKGRLIYNRYRVRGMVEELLEKREIEGFYLTTGRVLPHYNNANQTSRCKTLEKFKLFKEDVVYASEKDRERLKNGKRIKLKTENGETPFLPLEFNKHVRKGTLFVTFHRAKSSINSLFGDESDRFVKTAKFKSIKVDVTVEE
ncbi:formate dehydrogenase major subunit [Balnearium lithotrophicum]|uniref:Formate dehydrogenase major subunit n=1 Tax=Balnearium lithotrophicum TaxID=223788 RepID=A0A521BEG3_9BACT|nr:molybdopterin-dependent oxidoreductase [Balnearium lithotrophicum]SMO45130.1 formate dehydrogenase major subunit [Balnearium lithotrophicum]